jgi:hypothetical protein
MELNPDVKVNFVTTDMCAEEIEFAKKMQAILHFLQCQLKIFENLDIYSLNTISYHLRHLGLAPKKYRYIYRNLSVLSLQFATFCQDMSYIF